MSSVGYADFADAVEDVSRGNPKLRQGDYLEAGRLPVVDQGRKIIAGFTDDADLRCRIDDPVIVFGDHTRHIKYVDFPFVVGADGVKVLRVRDGWDSRYVFHYLRFAKIPSAGYSRHFKFLKELQIPWFPVGEQRRIAAILDRADAIRAKHRQILTRLDDLTQAIFHDMFGERPHRTVPIGDFAVVKSGSTPSRSEPSYFGGSIPWVKTGEVFGVISETEEHVTLAGMERARLHLFPAGSVVIAMYGQGKTRGQSAILAVDATVNQACAVIVPNDRFDSNFLQAQLRVDYERLRRAAEGGNQANLSGARISKFPVLLPPLKQQRIFADRVSALNRARRAAEGILGDNELLFASLQSRAFRGEL